MCSLALLSAMGYICLMDRPLLCPLNDYVFKRLMGEHLTVTASLLTAVLGTEIVPGDIRITDPQARARKRNDKLNILDIRIEAKGLGIIDLEAQRFNYPSLSRRILYYLTRTHAGQLYRGKPYTSLKPTRAIVIADFPFDDAADEDDTHQWYSLYNQKRRRVYPDAFELHFVDVTNIRKDDASLLTLWCRFFLRPAQRRNVCLLPL